MTETSLAHWSDAASVAGFFLSLVSLALTIAVYRNLKKLREDYIFRGRVPVLVNELRQHASMLLEFHREFASSQDEVASELSTAKATVRSLERKLGKAEQKQIKRLIECINSYEVKRDKAALWIVYNQMQEVIADAKNAQEDRSWTRQ